MAISMYQVSVPVFTRMLGNLSALIDKAVTHAEARKIDPEVLVNARLYPDMLPFKSQVFIACDMAKFCCARLAGVEAPRNDDSETTFAQLKERIAFTLGFIGAIKPEQIDGTEEKQISLKIAGNPMEFRGQFYLLHFVTPNFYFHVATAYDLLRHNGVELSKSDFLGPQA
jgi:hypothetical protein